MKQETVIDLRLMNEVEGTSTNAEGLTLYCKLDTILSEGNKVRLSLHLSTPFSSSFLNSSFGNLIDKFGIDKVKASISLIEYRPSLAKRLSEYLNEYSTISG
ncbi:MAG: DUF4325 domain-containing protein [Saprospiraceae bacterium]|nr:DUF4325 domain-containing protein [Saprospiraceae bacterium]